MTAVLVLALLPPGAVPQPTGDKVNHVLAFASLALLGQAAFPGRLRWVMPSLLVFGGVIELLQALTPYRQASGIDVAADAVGIMLGAAIAALIMRGRRHGSGSRAR